MPHPEPLKVDQLAHRCDEGELPFKNSDDLEELNDIIGQARAMGSIEFGIGIQHKGFNLYLMGPAGMGKHSIIRRYLATVAPKQPKPDDWCYLYNFEQRHKPKALRLKHRMGVKLQQDMAKFATELGQTLPALFESEHYREQLEQLEGQFRQEQEQAFDSLSRQADAQGVKLFRTPSGFAFAPVQENEVLSPENFAQLPKVQQQQVEGVIDELHGDLQGVLQKIPLWQRQTRERVEQLNRKMATDTVAQLLTGLRKRYQRWPAVLDYLKGVEQDVVERIGEFVAEQNEVAEETPELRRKRLLGRYKVNNLLLHKEVEGAPVIYLDNPTYTNLVGKLEYQSQMGNLVTDFTLLKPGALHQANGGYLILDGHKLLSNPYAWEGLKRALNSNTIKIESPDQMLSMNTTISLDPEEIPLNLKVVLLGDRQLYYQLYHYDPEFSELFRVLVDFEEELPRNPENVMLLARLIGSVVHKEKLLTMDAGAIAEVIDYASRMVEDGEKLSVHMRSIADLLREADYYTRKAGKKRIRRERVRYAIEQKSHRAARLQESLDESILRGDTLIQTSGRAVGQVNGLTVLSTGDYSFGQPVRISATVHLGEGGVLDIERETELAGAIHTKGVLILTSFLTARYAQQRPLALSGSLVFEQSYSEVDGDSASMAEVTALISAMSQLPVQQALAITGSMNQFGQAQPIGGVNEKIEGFFRLCQQRGLTGEQGVIIPATNIKNLMLEPAVMAAVEAGQFRIYAVTHVDEALELLLGVVAGEPNSSGQYPKKSVNYQVIERLKAMHHLKQLATQEGERH